MTFDLIGFREMLQISGDVLEVIAFIDWLNDSYPTQEATPELFKLCRTGLKEDGRYLFILNLEDLQ